MRPTGEILPTEVLILSHLYCKWSELKSGLRPCWRPELEFLKIIFSTKLGFS